MSVATTAHASRRQRGSEAGPLDDSSYPTVPATVCAHTSGLRYAADWATCTDWCAATNKFALPADWVTANRVQPRIPALQQPSAGGSPPSVTITLPVQGELIAPGQFEMLKHD